MLIQFLFIIILHAHMCATKFVTFIPTRFTHMSLSSNLLLTRFTHKSLSSNLLLTHLRLTPCSQWLSRLDAFNLEINFLT